MCRYSAIKDFDIEQGDGINVSVWFQGCSHRCKGCHNPQTWNFEGGKEFTNREIDIIIDLLIKDYDDIGFKNLSILGGEPLEDRNIPMLTKLVQRVKEVSKDIKIFLWTGYRLEEKLSDNLELFECIDVVIDGKFIEEEKEITRYKGSKNQRVIDLKAHSLVTSDVY